jgi:mitochondrial fission protein ELM1
VWCLTDGKPGHENQSRGLLASLERRVRIEVFLLRVPSQWTVAWSWMRRRAGGDNKPLGWGDGLPAPDLIIAAGHATHLAALAARAGRGGQVVLLMKPSLPLRWFDLCLIPEHDIRPGRAQRVPENVIVTRGVLNNVRPSSAADGRRGLMLIGGPSKHHAWDDRRMTGHIVAVADAEPAIQWTLATSRRTPASFLRLLQQHARENLKVIPCTQTGPGWLASQLATVGTVFVSEDSVSMVYEALSSAAHVGLLPVTRRRTSRVVRGIDRLIEDRLVIPLEQWQSCRFEHRTPHVLQEADRCATIVCERVDSLVR